MVQKICTPIILLLIVTSIYVNPITAKQLSDAEFKPQNIAPNLSNCTVKTETIGVPSPGFPMGDGGLFFTGVFLSNAKPYIWDLDVITYITHPVNSGLDITLRSPAGTNIVLSTGNGGSNSNVFNGTRWDDQAEIPVTDYGFSEGVIAVNLAPEEALGAFIGENPNGSWSLDIIDKPDGYAGNFIRLTMVFTLCPGAPVIDSFQKIKAVSVTPILIPDNDQNGLVSELVVPASIDGPIYDVNLETEIAHPNNQELSIILISPTGTEVTISTNNGDDKSNVFNGTRWDDKAGSPVTDFVFTDGVTATNLVAEGALSAYNGESPNGIWKLKIVDSQSGNTGSLSSWALNMKLGASPLKMFLPVIIKTP